MNMPKPYFPLTLSQEDIYFDQMYYPDCPLYNIGGYIQFCTICPERLIQAHRQLVHQCDIFGLRVKSDNAGAVQYTSNIRSFELPIIDFSEYSEPERQAGDFLVRLFESPLAFEDCELFKVFLLKLSGSSWRYVAIAHHLMMDGWGFSNWAHQLGQFYKDSKFVATGLNWQEIVEKENGYQLGSRFKKDCQYWQEYLSGMPIPLLPPAAHSDQIARSKRHIIDIPAHKHLQLGQLAAEYSVSVNQLYMAMCAIYFSSVYDRKEVTFGLPIHNRSQSALKKAIGVFIGICPLRIVVEAEQSLAEICRQIADDQKKNYRHQKFPIGHMIRCFSADKAAVMSYGNDVLTDHPGQITVAVTYVSPEYFDLLVPAVSLGRLFTDSENPDSYNPVAVITHNAWVETFGADPNILDKSVAMSGKNFRVVGVLASSFIEPEIAESGRSTRIYLPWDFNQATSERRQQWHNIDRATFLLVKKPDSLSTVQAELKSTGLVAPVWREQVTAFDFFDGWDVRINVVSLKDIILGDSKQTILLLIAGITGLVLIAVANITNLYISRTSKQLKKLTILASIGAKRRDLFYGIWAESFIVIACACVLALIFAQLGLIMVKAYLAEWLPRSSEVSLNLFTMILALVVMLLLSTIFALFSAGLINYRALVENLKGSGKGTGIQVSSKIRNTMITSQVAIATTLIFFNLMILYQAIAAINKPLGFKFDNVNALELSVAASELPPRDTIAPVIRQIRRSIEDLPQVKGVSQTSSPFQRFAIWMVNDITTNEKYTPEGRVVDFNYFSMIGQPLVQGRYFTEQEVKSREKLMIINEAFAERLAQDGEVIGAKLASGGDDYFTVVGVVKNIGQLRRNDVPYQVYSPTHDAYTQMLIETHPGQKLSRAILASTIKDTTSLFSVYSFENLEEIKDGLVFTDFISAITTASLAVLTFVLAAIGLYGIFSYGVQIRVFEFGTRLAIGARRKDIARLVLRENAAAIVLGVGLSLICVVLAFAMLDSYLAFELEGRSVLTYLLAVFLVILTSWISSVIPLSEVINRPVIHSLRT